MQTKIPSTDIDFGIYKLEKAVQVTADPYLPRRRGLYMIIFSGPIGAKHLINNETLEIPPHSALYIGPERLSHFDRDEFPETYILIFSSRFYHRSPRDSHFLQNSALFNDFTRLYYLTPPAEALAYCKAMINLLYRARENFQVQLNEDLAHNVVQQILIMGTLLHKIVPLTDFKNNPEQMLVLKYKELVKIYSKQNRTVKFYAEKLNVTERKLNRATENILGIGAKDLIVQDILTEAKQQLTYSDKTIKEISFELGFSEENNFSAFFSKQESCTPSQFRTNTKLKVLVPRQMA
jgi:AraC family transcriptional activator of pobA